MKACSSFCYPRCPIIYLILQGRGEGMAPVQQQLLPEPAENPEIQQLTDEQQCDDAMVSKII